MKALIIIDMLRDFVDGALANPKAQAIIPNVRRLLDVARADPSEWAVVFANDAHDPEDPELKVWGEHAMRGSDGAEVIDALAPADGDFVVTKGSYGAFDETRLDVLLRTLGVTEVVLAGQHTHICVRHTAYGALIRGYEITVPADAVCAFDDVDEDEALRYLHDVYGATLTMSREIAAEQSAV